jgi:ribosomal protein L37E
MELPTKEEIIKRLIEKGATNPCPRCGNQGFTVLDGFLSHAVQHNFQNLSLGGEVVPTIITVCAKCGFLSLHSMGVLGFLPAAEKEAKQ